MVDEDDGAAGASGTRRAPQVVGALTPFDPGPSLQAAAAALEAEQAPFALIGGLALEAWGIARATKDADLAVPVGMAEAAAQRLSRPGAELRPLRIGGVAVRDEGLGLSIDFVDRRFHFGALFASAIAEAGASGRVTKAGSLSVPLVSLEHLLAMKMVSGEPKDDADVRRILRLETLDYRGAHALVEQHLGVATANRLDAMAREAGRPELPPLRLYENGEHTEDD